MKISVKPELLDEWIAYTVNIGFPGMLAQPGCQRVFRLVSADSKSSYHIMTIWDSLEDLERFRSSDDLRILKEKSAHLTFPDREELLFETFGEGSYGTKAGAPPL